MRGGARQREAGAGGAYTLPRTRAVQNASRGPTEERDPEASPHHPMSYARNLLSRGEDVVYESRQHWFAVVARVLIWFLVLIVALAILIWISQPGGIINDTVDGLIMVVTLVGFLGGLAYIGFAIWDWRNQEWLI